MALPNNMPAAARLEIQSLPEPNSGCVLWDGWIGNHGYGILKHEKKAQLAHRVAWILTHGPIPKGMHICHHCDVRACVNVEHMFLGTPADNMADKVRKGRQRRGVRVPQAKLNTAAVREIIAAAAARKSFHWGARALAEKYGVSEKTISLIALGKSWRAELEVASR